MDFVDLFDRSSAWAARKMPSSTDALDGSTPCEEWNVRALVNHMIEVQHWLRGAATEGASGGPADPPPDRVGTDAAADYEAARQGTLAVLREPGAAEKAGMFLGICFVDQLMHGWDVAKATGQDATMPEDLAATAFSVIDGRMDDPSMRGKNFKPRIEVPDDAPVQHKLLAYGGRGPQ
ncbi:MAG TPA: TIGR03086 family metal-binding protein [Acidimicrobiales bacterium]